MPLVRRDGVGETESGLGAINGGSGETGGGAEGDEFGTGSWAGLKLLGEPGGAGVELDGIGSGFLRRQ